MTVVLKDYLGYWKDLLRVAHDAWLVFSCYGCVCPSSSTIIRSTLDKIRRLVHVWDVVQQVFLGLLPLWCFTIGYIQDADIPEKDSMSVCTYRSRCVEARRGASLIQPRGFEG